MKKLILILASVALPACSGKLPRPADPAACAAAIGEHARAAAEVTSASLALADCKKRSPAPASHFDVCLDEADRVAVGGARLVAASAQVAVACARAELSRAQR